MPRRRLPFAIFVPAVVVAAVALASAWPGAAAAQEGSGPASASDAPLIPDKPPLPGEQPEPQPPPEPPPGPADDDAGASSGGPVASLRIDNLVEDTPLTRSLLAAVRGAAMQVMRDAGWRVFLPQYSGEQPPGVIRHRLAVVLAQAAHRVRQVNVGAPGDATLQTREWHEIDVLVDLRRVDQGQTEALVLRRSATGDSLSEAVKRLELARAVRRALAQRIQPALRVDFYPNKTLTKSFVADTPLRIEGGRADTPVGSLVRLRYGEAEESGFAQVVESDPGKRHLRLRPFDWPEKPTHGRTQLWVEPLPGTGLRLSGGVGFMLTHNDSTPVGAFIIPEQTGSVALSAQFAWDWGAPLIGQPGLLVGLGFQFAQGSPMKSYVVELAFSGDLWLADRLSLTPGLGFGVGANELSHISLASVFGTTRTKAKQTIVTITPSVEVAWRLMPSLSVHAQLGWRFVITPAGHDVFTTQGMEAEIDGINAESGRLSFMAGIRVFF